MADDSVDVGNTLLFVFLGVLQIYILLLPGVKGYFRKFINNGGNNLINGLLYNVYIPVYSILEVSRMASLANVKLYWFLAISVTICILLRLVLSYVLNIIIGSDKKTAEPYAMLNTFPAVGSLTLVIGKAMCYEGCPLYGDPQCDNVLGLMMINYLIYSVLVFVIGFIIHANALKKNSIMKEKLRHLWYRFLTVKNRKDLIPQYIFYKYLSYNEKKAEELYNTFIDNNTLDANEEHIYHYKTKKGDTFNTTKFAKKLKSMHVSDKLLTNMLKSRSMIDKTAMKQNYDKSKKEKVEKEHKEVKKAYFDEGHEFDNVINQNAIVPTEEINLNKNGKADNNNNNFESVSEKDEDIFERDSDVNKNDIENGDNYHKDKENDIEKNNSKEDQTLQKKGSILKGAGQRGLKKKKTIIIEHDFNPFASASFKYPSRSMKKTRSFKGSSKQIEQIDDFNTRVVVQEMEIPTTKSIFLKRKMDNIEEDAFKIFHRHQTLVKIENTRKRANSFEVFRNKKRDEFLKMEDEKDKIEEDPLYVERQVISSYYNEMFNTVTKVVSDEEKLEEAKRKKILHDIGLEKELLLSHINEDNVPRYHVVDSLHLSGQDAKDLDSLWDEYENNVMDAKGITVTLHVNVFSINAKMILKKIHNPPVLGCIIGIFIGMSGMRDVLFSSNHYLVNLFELIPVTGKAYVPLLFASVGYTLMIAPKFNKNFTLSKLQFYISFLMSYIIFPALGIGFLFLWIHGYAGIVATSKVFRFCMFICFILPTSPNFVIVINILEKFYLEEYGYTMARHFYAMIVTTTLLVLVYFVVIN